jgi:hypothetical protein
MLTVGIGYFIVNRIAQDYTDPFLAMFFPLVAAVCLIRLIAYATK